MARPTPANDVPVRRIDRVLTFMSLGLLVVSLACFVVTEIAIGVGMDYGNFAGLWLLIRFFPFFALPVAFVLIVVLLVMTSVRRGRLNRGG